MAIRLFGSAGEFILPEGFSFEIEINHPFFSDSGCSSLPISLPYCTENLRMMGWPNRMGRTSDCLDSYDVVLECGLFRKNGQLVLNSVSKDNGIQCSLAFSESEMYAKFKSTKVKDLLQSKVSSISYADLYDIYISGNKPVVNEFAAFPVYVDEDEFNTYLLNEVTDGAFVTGPRFVHNDKGDTLSLPEGYGVTPFLYLSVFLQEIFERCGFTVKENCFTVDPWHQLVLVNNCADAMCIYNTVRWSDLVPDLTMGEIISWLKDRFAAIVILDGRDIAIKFMDSIFKTPPIGDLSMQTMSDYNVSRPSPSRVAVSVNTSLSDAAPLFDTVEDIPTHIVEYDSIEDVRNGYGYIPYCGAFVRASGGEILERGSTAFKLFRNNAIDCEEHQAIDEYLPLKEGKVGLLTYIGPRIHNHTSVDGFKEAGKQSLQICWNSGSSLNSEKGYHIIKGGYKPALTPEGLRTWCWDYYNDLLLNKAPEISCRIQYPFNLLSAGSDRVLPYTLYGRKVIIKSVVLQISEEGAVYGNSTLLCYPEPISLTDSDTEYI